MNIIYIEDLYSKGILYTYKDELYNYCLSLGDEITVEVCNLDSVIIYTLGEVDIKDLCSSVCVLLIEWGIINFSISLDTKNENRISNS